MKKGCHDYVRQVACRDGGTIIGESKRGFQAGMKQKWEYTCTISTSPPSMASVCDSGCRELGCQQGWPFPSVPSDLKSSRPAKNPKECTGLIILWDGGYHAFAPRHGCVTASLLRWASKGFRLTLWIGMTRMAWSTSTTRLPETAHKYKLMSQTFGTAQT